MVEVSPYQKDIPSRTYRGSVEEEGALEIMAPPHRPKSYRGKIRLGFIVYSINAKHALRALGNRYDDISEIYRRPIKQATTPDNHASSLTPYGQPSDLIDLDWRNWDIFDYVSACGIVLMIIGFVTAIFPSVRAGGALFPIGLGLMTLAAYGARRRDTHST